MFITLRIISINCMYILYYIFWNFLKFKIYFMLEYPQTYVPVIFCYYSILLTIQFANGLCKVIVTGMLWTSMAKFSLSSFISISTSLFHQYALIANKFQCVSIIRTCINNINKCHQLFRESKIKFLFEQYSAQM